MEGSTVRLDVPRSKLHQKKRLEVDAHSERYRLENQRLTEF